MLVLDALLLDEKPEQQIQAYTTFSI